MKIFSQRKCNITLLLCSCFETVNAVRGWLGYLRSATPSCITLAREKKNRNKILQIILNFSFAWNFECCVPLSCSLRLLTMCVLHSWCFVRFNVLFSLMLYNLKIACIIFFSYFRLIKRVTLYFVRRHMNIFDDSIEVLWLLPHFSHSLVHFDALSVQRIEIVFAWKTTLKCSIMIAIV